MDVTKLHDEENLLVQMQDRWERSALLLRYAKNYGSLDAIVDRRRKHHCPSSSVIMSYGKDLLL